MERAMGSLLWITAKKRRQNSSTLKILSRCFFELWIAFSTHNFKKFDLQESKNDNRKVMVLFYLAAHSKLCLRCELNLIKSNVIQNHKKKILYIQPSKKKIFSSHLLKSSIKVKQFRTYPMRKTSASFKKAELTSKGKGYFSSIVDSCTIASHCSPTFRLLSPEKEMKFGRESFSCTINIWHNLQSYEKV